MRAKKPVEPVVTHWSYWDAPTRGRGRYATQRALCGAQATAAEQAADPTCDVCKAKLAEQAEQTEPPF
jgi:hypothetical protein